MSREAVMRADSRKQAKFDRLRSGPLFAAVVEANRAYVRATIPDPESTECDRWAMSCLPSTNALRISAISIKTMETFVLHLRGEAEPADQVELRAFVIVRRSRLQDAASRPLAKLFPDLEFEDSPYFDAGDDQIRARGSHDAIVRALEDTAFADAARDLVAPLLESRTLHARGHSYQLADHVLGRA